MGNRYFCDWCENDAQRLTDLFCFEIERYRSPEAAEYVPAMLARRGLAAPEPPRPRVQQQICRPCFDLIREKESRIELKEDLNAIQNNDFQATPMRQAQGGG